MWLRWEWEVCRGHSCERAVGSFLKLYIDIFPLLFVGVRRPPLFSLYIRSLLITQETRRDYLLEDCLPQDSRRAHVLLQ